MTHCVRIFKISINLSQMITLFILYLLTLECFLAKESSPQKCFFHFAMQAVIHSEANPLYWMMKRFEDHIVILHQVEITDFIQTFN